MSNFILPGQTIGVIGGKHISKMLVMSAKQYGLTVGILDPLENCPASQVADWQIVGEYHDESSLVKLAKACDMLIYESQNIDVKALLYLEEFTNIPQGTLGLTITKNRLLEREFLDNHSINILPFETAVLISDVKEAAQNVGYPCIVKGIDRLDEQTDRFVKIDTITDIDLAVPLIQKGACIVEPYVPIVKELFLSVGINQDGEYTLFPIVETINERNGDLSKIKAPIEIYDIDEQTKNQIELIAQVIASELGTSGIVGVEFFVTESNTLYVNEISSIEHESSSYSVDACDFSEYDICIRGVCNWSLPKVSQLVPAITFLINKDNHELVIAQLKKKRQWHYHFYQYPEEVKANILGHVTVLTENLEESIQELKYMGLF